MKQFRELKEYLDSFVNYENRINYGYRKAFKLGKVRRLLKELEVYYRKIKAIHIAGTKGKGSSAIFVSYLLAASGFKVGLYTSPHFRDFRERIKIIKLKAGKVRESLISAKNIVNIVNKFKPKIDRFSFSAKPGKPTVFEIYTAVAFQFFLENDVDYAVLETGLGGRLDATNVVRPLVSIITHIGYDHTQKLGRCLESIACEKAGIIKRNVPVITANQRRSALRVILKKAHRMNAESFVLGKEFGYYNVKLAKLTHFDFVFGNVRIKNMITGLQGVHQLDNASLALASMCILIEKGRIKKRINYKKGIREAYLEGRFETVLQNPLIILDVAHNVSSFRVLYHNIKHYFPKKKIIFIFAASEDKDIKKMLSVISYDKIIITSFGNPRAAPAHKIKELCGTCSSIEPSVYEALEKAQLYYNRESLILVSGSFFLVAEAKDAIKRLYHVDKRL